MTSRVRKNRCTHMHAFERAQESAVDVAFEWRGGDEEGAEMDELEE